MSVTHSAVSQHIKQLEALVGVTLFIRHGRGCASRKKDGSMPCKSARRYSTSPTPRAWCRSNPAPWKCPGDAPLLWLPLAAAAAGALSGAASADRGAPADQPGSG
nr:LysR family transcriptional regulator [Klebsiella pneumoniae subsp. pneumoniae]